VWPCQCLSRLRLSRPASQRQHWGAMLKELPGAHTSDSGSMEIVFEAIVETDGTLQDKYAMSSGKGGEVCSVSVPLKSLTLSSAEFSLSEGSLSAELAELKKRKLHWATSIKRRSFNSISPFRPSQSPSEDLDLIMQTVWNADSSICQITSKAFADRTRDPLLGSDFAGKAG